jgi:hypothetical protein
MTQDLFTQICPEVISETKKQKTPLSKKSKRWAQALPWYCDKYNPVRGECGLWMAVVTQAMMDALSRSTHPEQRYHKQTAIQWLTGNSKDFYLVCSLAGVDPDYVRRRAKKAMMAPVEWRAGAGKGSRYEERKAYRARVKKMAPPAEDEPRSGPAQIICGPWQ